MNDTIKVDGWLILDRKLNFVDQGVFNSGWIFINENYILLMMSDTKLLKKIIDGQSAMHASLLSELNKGLDGLKKDVKRLDKKIDKVDKKVDYNSKRLDRIGRQLAYLEDDTPTKEEFVELEERVTKVEEVLAVV